MRANVKPAAFAAPATSVTGGVPEIFASHSCEPGVLTAYAPFIRDGFVSCVGSEVKVPVKILRDTGPYDSYVVDSIPPLSGETDTGDCVLSRGMGLKILPVPLHKMIVSWLMVR